MNPNAPGIWPGLPAFSNSNTNSSNIVDETCGARGGVCATQNIPGETCLGTFTLFGLTICTGGIFAPPVWPLATTSAVWTPKCPDVVNGSVPKPNPGGSPNIDAHFTPNFGFTLAQAEQVCNFINFNWQSTFTSLPLPNPFKAAGSTVSLQAPPSFNDPPPQGYAYQTPPNAVELPVYYNMFTHGGKLSLDFHQTNTTMTFHDAPDDPCLIGASPLSIATYCGGNTAPAGSKMAIITHLVGIQGDLPGAAVIDTTVGFRWISTWNGTTGGAVVLNTDDLADPGSGTGGITIMSSNETTNYQAGMSSPPTLLESSQISTVVSGTQSVTITNDSDSTIAGPFQVVFYSSPLCYVLANATGSIGGDPYITVPGVDSLEPGQSATVDLQWSVGPCAVLRFPPPLIYSGSFD